MTTKKIQKIENDYKSGMKFKDIESKNKISHNDLRNLIKTQKWKRESNRSETAKNNKNAVVTGEYETIYEEFLNEKELKNWNSIKLENDNKRQMLENEYKLLCIREMRMLARIKELTGKEKDLTIKSITKTKIQNIAYTNDGESITTFAENTIDNVQRIEESLTRIQAQKLKVISEIHKIYIDDNRLELELLRLEREISRDSPPESSMNNDNNLIEALNMKAKEVWSDGK